ncbi:hypothetical protein ATCCBAA256_13380 [Mycobacterium montefiorense]|nr:hypothetical protein ATCCBAA256_13380 [Mycobacterium montefiorense]
MAVDSLRVCECPAVLPALGLTCDHAAGSGNVAAENWDRNAEPATRLMNKPSAATTAMARCHRRECPASQTFTVARLYNTKAV